MSTENLYRPKGAGHNVPKDRRNYVRPRDELFDAFKMWLDRLPNNVTDGDLDQSYNSALEVMPDLSGITDDVINSLLISFEKHPNICAAGLFLSAAYNRMQQTRILFDSVVDAKIDHIGHMLGEDKILIISDGAGKYIAKQSAGTVVNYGKLVGFGSYSTGTLINFGNIRILGDYSHGISVNFGKVHMLGPDSHGLIMNCGEFEECGRDASGTIITVRGRPSYMNLMSQIREDTRAYAMTELVLDELRCKGIPELAGYLDDLGKRLNGSRPHEEVFKELEELDVGADLKKIFRNHKIRIGSLRLGHNIWKAYHKVCSFIEYVTSLPSFP